MSEVPKYIFPLNPNLSREDIALANFVAAHDISFSTQADREAAVVLSLTGKGKKASQAYFRELQEIQNEAIELDRYYGRSDKREIH